MFGIGGFELLIILIFGFILVGDRLPDVAKTLGRALRTFQNAQRDMSKVIREGVFDPDADEPFKDPLAALDKMGGIAKKTGSSLADDLNEMAAAAKKKKVETAPEKSAASSQEEVPAVAEEAPAEEATSAPAETFAERRARYERERAARLAAQAEEKAAAEAAAAQEALQAADELVVQVEGTAPEGATAEAAAPEGTTAEAATAEAEAGKEAQ